MRGSVVVVGAINVDLVVRAERLPSPGVTVAGSGLATFGGGKGANAAVAASRVGADVRLVAAVGADANGDGALAELVADGVDVTHVARLDAEPTGVALIVVDAAGENQIALGPGANGAITAAMVDAALAVLLPDAACVLVSTEIPPEAVVAAVRAATGAGVRCVLNPAPAASCVIDTLGFGPLLTPNESELQQLAAMVGYDGRADRAPAALTALTSASVVATRGGDGCLIVEPGQEEPLLIAAPVTDVVDTTGAGDTFNGVLVAGLAAGLDLEVAARRATVAASLSVRAAGARTGMPTAAELT